MKRIVILGAGGQIGSILFRELKKISTFKVHGTSRFRRIGLLKFSPLDDDWSVLGHVDVLINCIGLIKEDKANSFERIHVDVAKKIMTNRALLGNPRIIQVSAQGASSLHPVTFLRSKGTADEYFLTFGNTYVLRPSIICTHKTMMVRKLLLLARFCKFFGGVLFLPGGFGKQKIQPVMPCDVVAMVYVLIHTKHPVRILDVPGPEPISLNRLIVMLMKNKNKSFRVFEIPKSVVDPLIKYVVGPLFPQWIDHQQYRLLFSNIASDTAFSEKYLRKPLHSTLGFWEKELDNH